MTERYRIDGEDLTEDEVLDRIRRVRERRTALEKARERKEREEYMRDRHRLMVYSERLLDWAESGSYVSTDIQDVVVGLVGLFLKTE